MTTESNESHMSMRDLERRARVTRRITINQKIANFQRTLRKITGAPEPHDKFTPYHKLTDEEKRQRVARIRRMHRGY